MATTPVRVSLDRSFESLCDEFRRQLAKKCFYELASVVQALRPWKDLVRDLLEGPVTGVNLHSYQTTLRMRHWYLNQVEKQLQLNIRSSIIQCMLMRAIFI